MPFRDYKHQPDESIADALVKNNFPLSGNKVFSHDPLYLAKEEYARIDNLLQRKLEHLYNQNRITYPEIMLKYQQLSSMVIRRERKIRKQLENLAIEIIKEIFNPPEHLNLEAMISSRINMDVNPDDQKPSMLPDLSPERLAYLNEQVQRRVILNGLVQGSAMHIWKSCHYLVAEKLEEISPSLMALYDEYISLTSFSLWNVNVSLVAAQVAAGNEMGMDMRGYMTQGQEQLGFGEGGATIEVKAVNFPVMLHELTKGIIDYLICHAIPEDLTEAELDYYYAKADAFENEIWHYILSPSLWNMFSWNENCNTQELPKRIYELCKLDYQQLSQTMNNYIDEYRANNNS